MTMLVLAAVAFLALHLVVSGSPLRGVIVGRIGEAAFLGLFSLLSAGGIVLLAVDVHLSIGWILRLLWGIWSARALG